MKRLHIWCAAVLAAAALAAVVGVFAASPFVPDSQPIGYVGQPVPSSTDVSSGNAVMYSINYDVSTWSGNLHAYPISSDGAVGTVDDWGTGGAAQQIARQSRDNMRKIVTMLDGEGIEFKWSALSAAQKAVLDLASATASESPLLNYLRGDKSREGTGANNYRVRAGGMGDIIHSTPVYWDDGSNKTVFVGANDGMLHAINAVDGSERFAYVPATLLPRLPALASQSYSHQYYVDGRLDIRTFDRTTVLVGTLGAGGKGVFALNVSNAAPATELAAAGLVMWEINNASAGYADLGDTYGAPSLFMLPGGTPALALGNGYNNTGSGKAALFLVNPLTGALIRKLETTSAGSPSAPNGLSSPSLWDADGDGYKDTAYAGDIDGNMWKFQLTAPYTVTRLHTTAGAAHAITMAPGLMAHPLGGVMVQFVSGRMLTGADVADASEHYAYGLWDSAPASNLTLLEQVLTEESFVSGDTTIRVRTSTRHSPNWTAGHHRGWRTKLPIGGERVVGDGAYVTNGVFQFFSTNPTINRGATPSGENWWMQLNALTGGDSGKTLFDLNGDKQFTSADNVGGLNAVGRNMGPGVRSQLIGLSAGGLDVFQSNFDRNSAPEPATTETTTRTIAGDRGVSGGHFDTDIFCYQYCGEATRTYRTIFSADGYYSVGQDESNGHTDGLNYVHVHEYDDIYDRVGLNMLHPSQDKQRLRLVKQSVLHSVTHAPNTPSHQSASTWPADATVESLTYYEGDTRRTVPAASHTYSHSAPVSHGTPAVSRDADNTYTTTQQRYTTQVESWEPYNVRNQGNRNNPRYAYDLRRTVRRWTTVISTVYALPNFRFKILVANQAYSPAVTLRVEGAENAAAAGAAFNDKVFNFQSTNGLDAGALPTYRIDDISRLVFSMPLDAFNIRDWGTGVSRTGLHPIRPTCAGISVARPTNGPLGEWRNGALTLQVVDASVTSADVELNVSGRPDLGYRLKPAKIKSKLVAEYLIYWHHPNEQCMESATWTSSPPQDTESDAREGRHAAGENDPVGVFRPGNGLSGSGAVPSNPAPVVVTHPNGSTTTTTITYTALASGGYTETTTVTRAPASVITTIGIVTGGVVSDAGIINTGGIDRNAQMLGRINWRELKR